MFLYLDIDGVCWITHFMRDCSIDEGKQPFFAHGHLVFDLWRYINNLQHLMLAKTCINNVAMDLHILKRLVIIVIHFMNYLVNIVSGLLLAQIE